MTRKQQKVSILGMPAMEKDVIKPFSLDHIGLIARFVLISPFVKSAIRKILNICINSNGSKRRTT